MKLNDKRVVNAWCMYDWANSVYSLTITTAIFPIYFKAVTKGADGSIDVEFFGYTVPNSALYAYNLSFSFLVIAALLPLLTGIADATGSKKAFMRFFTYLGAIACLGLFYFTGENVEYGIICAFFASIGYSGGLVFYDAYLPDIVTEDKYDSVSARGYSFGYLGSVLLLVLNLAMVQFPETFFITADDPAVASGLASRISFLTVGVWWIVFGEYSFYHLPSNVHNIKHTGGKIIKKGYAEIQKVWKSLRNLPILKKFLWAFFFYNMGVQTVMYMATIFAEDEVSMTQEQLIITVLVIQLVAIGGATMFAKLSKRKGNKYTLLLMCFIWIGVCLYAYFVYTAMQFYLLAFTAGLVMGGIQALSRATYSKLIPENTIDSASYFSFYDVAFNVSIVLGTFAYGLISQFVDTRMSVVAIGLFIVVGLGFLLLVKIPKKPLSGHHAGE